MRKEIVNHLHKLMSENDDIIVLTGDLGFGLFDQIKKDYPERFINCGAAEQAMSDIAVGIALSGKIPVVYSITPFLLYRAFETLRTYIDHEKIKVILLGSGRDDDYAHEGFSHDAGDDHLFMFSLHQIKSHWPVYASQAVDILTDAIEGDNPVYINLRK